MKMPTKGMTRKQILTILESMILDDNVCITESDVCYWFETYADDYEAEYNHDGDIKLTLIEPNDY